MFFSGVLEIGDMVITGKLDEYLATPRDPLLFLNARYNAVQRLFYNISSFAIFIFCSIKAGVPLNFRTFILFILFVASGILLQFALNVIIITLSFWYFRAWILQAYVLKFIEEYLKYPIQIYGAVGAFAFTFVLPIAFISYFPAAIITRTEHVYFSSWIGWFAPVLAVVLYGISYRFWRFGLKYYNSTGT